MSAFPAYAQILYKDFSQNRESALIRTEMESGPPKQARIKSRVMVTQNIKIYLASKADFASFQSWYKNDITDGADWFDYVDPITGSTIQARFRDGGYNSSPMTADLQNWELSAQIEYWSA